MTSAPAETWDPVADAGAAATLGASLRDVGYSEAAIEELLGEDGPAADETDALVFDRRLPETRLATAIRLALLQLDVERRDATHALGEDAVEALVRAGLAVAEGERLVPRARIVPVDGLLLAFDGFPRGADDPPGYVASFSPTASWCAALTPRRRVRRALDIGTGNGAQALFAARHAEHVVATDVNPRALAFTAFNAAMNGLGNVETRLGSLFDPVAGERFDLVTCNAPYVVSPETRWQYRDGGLPADELSRRVVTEAAAALADGGFATLLVSWLAETEDEPDERVLAWLEGCGCDAWVLGMAGADPLDHAAGWNEHLDGDELAAALDEWSAYFDELGVGWITEGAVVLHRTDAARQTVRTDAIEEDDLHQAGEQVERAFTARAALAALDGPAALLDLRLVFARTARIEQTYDPRAEAREARVYLEEGTWSELPVDPDAADVLAELDGSVALGRAVERHVRRAELSKREAAELRRDVVAAARDLLELGFFEPPRP